MCYDQGLPTSRSATVHNQNDLEPSILLWGLVYNNVFASCLSIYPE